MKAYKSIQKRMKTYESIQKHMKTYENTQKRMKACKRIKAYQSILKRLYQAASSSLDCCMLLLHQKVCCLSLSNELRLTFWLGEIVRNLELNY